MNANHLLSADSSSVPCNAARIITVPYDSGRRAWRMGAGPLVLAPLIERALSSHCAVSTQVIELDEELPEIRAAFALQDLVARAVADANVHRAMPIVLSGNCNVTCGIVSGLPTHDRVGVFWFDAHADLHTPETTTSGFLDGMALAMLAGRGWRAMRRGAVNIDENRIVLCGARDLDQGERDFLATASISHVVANDDTALSAAIGRLSDRVDSAHLHIDLDVLDTSVGRANSYARPDGYSREHLLGAIAMIRARFPLSSIAITAYDPEEDASGHIRACATEAVQHAVAGQ